MEVEETLPPQEKRKRTNEENEPLCVNCNKEARLSEDLSRFENLSEYMKSHYFCSYTCQSKYYEWELRRDGEIQWVHNRRIYFMRLLAMSDKVRDHIRMVQRAMSDVVDDVRKLVIFNIMDTMSKKYARTESGRLAASDDHVLFIGMRDTLFVQGPNRNNQLGIGPPQEGHKRIGPIAVRIPGIIFVATSDTYSAVITQNDDASSSLWITGQFVRSTNFGVSKFTRVDGIRDVIAVYCSRSHIDIIMKNGTMWSSALTDLVLNDDGTSILAQFTMHDELDNVISFGIDTYGFHTRVIKNDGTVWSRRAPNVSNVFVYETGLSDPIICLSMRYTSITLSNTVYIKKNPDKPLQSVLGNPLGEGNKDTDIVWFGDVDYGNIGLFLCVDYKTGATSLRRHYVRQKGGKIPYMDTVGNSDDIACVVISKSDMAPRVRVLKEDGSYWTTYYGSPTSKAPITLEKVDYLASLVQMRFPSKKPRCQDCKSSAHFSALCMTTGNVLHHCEAHYHQ